MEEKILKIAQNQMRSANLEATSVRRLVRSFFNKVLQWMAMTRFPIGAKNRCRLERLRGVKIGKNVFLGGGNILDRVRPDLITIEDEASLAGGVYILTHSNPTTPRSEEHTSELQSRGHLVCRLLLEKKTRAPRSG